MTNFTVFAKLGNGTSEQVVLTVSEPQKYFNFIENYEGNNLGNDIIFEDFVIVGEATGVILED